MGYISNFIVYTLAMVGVIVVALLVFKKATMGGDFSKSSKCMKLIDTMSLGPRKTLYIVSAGEEKFLIAGDIDKTTLISKLNSTPEAKNHQNNLTSFDKNFDSFTKDYSPKSFKDTLSSLPKSKYMDRGGVGIKSSILDNKLDFGKSSVLTELAEKLGRE